MEKILITDNKTYTMKKGFLFLLVLCIGLFDSCNENSTGGSDNVKADSTTMKATISERPFGNFEGKAVTEYTIINPSGMQVSILNYGGTVTKIITKDKDGRDGDVILGFDSLSGYLQKGNPYFGCLVGRYANRIANAKFSLDGASYTLAANDNGQSLHGGLKGFDKVMWTAEKLPDSSSLKLTYMSKDGEEGYPGNLKVEVVYSLTPDNELKIEYKASTDKPTPVNLTNHCYFNLSAGADSTILGHDLLIKADKYTPVNAKLIPLGKHEDVKNTAFDFTISKSIGKEINTVKGGYDHNWVLNRTGSGLEKIAILSHAESGRQVDVLTTEPGLQFYSGNFLDGTLTGCKGGKPYVWHGGLCLETQHFPDSPNQPSFPTTILKPGEIYGQLTVYKFSVNK
jgi:aldose 1-epimerase